jgi:hypothetical protein
VLQFLITDCKTRLETLSDVRQAQHSIKYSNFNYETFVSMWFLNLLTMNSKRLDIYPARARSDPSLQVGVRGDPQGISALRIDPPEQIESKGHPPEVRQARNGSPADSARDKPSEIQNFRKMPRVESRISGYPQGTQISGKISFRPELKFNRLKAEIDPHGKGMSGKEQIRQCPLH